MTSATMGYMLIVAAFAAYVVFWIRFFTHILLWWRAAQRLRESRPLIRSRMTLCVLTTADVLLFSRLLNVNPALWFGEWIFHASFLLVLLRHLRYFLDPVPTWVWCAQTPGLIGGYLLPFSLAYILSIRLATKHEKYASPANVVLLALALAISSLGLVMYTWFKPDLVEVKLFITGILHLAPAAAPDSVLFFLHFALVLVLIPLLPTHIVTAPFVMLEARRRELALPLVMHEK